MHSHDVGAIGNEPTGSASRVSIGPAGEGLLSWLDVIEEQPLAARAASYLHLHHELSARLEGANASSRESTDASRRG